MNSIQINPEQTDSCFFNRIYRKNLNLPKFFLIFLFCISMSYTFSQDVNMTLSLRDVTVAHVFSEIEKNSKYTFAFDNTEIDLTRIVSVEAEDSKVEKILELIFEDTNVFYKISNNHILLAAISKIPENDLAVMNFFVSGRVLSASDKLPIPGVNILEKGTMNGTITDVDGNFTLTTRSNNSILQFSTIGYVSRDLELGGQFDFSIEMEEHIELLEQVVIVGYGKRKKADLTSSISSISSQELIKAPVATFQQSIQGLVPGIEVVANRGGPGEGAIVLVRSIGSINNTNPLFVIDGVPIVETNYDFDKPSISSLISVNPLDIESVHVLKDAAACAIYGTRGANGVVLITTKKGKVGETTVTYNGYSGIQKEGKRLDVLNAEQYAVLNNTINQNAINSGIDGPRLLPVSADPENMPYNTDWQDEIFRSAPIHSQSISISGGKNKSHFNISGSYFNQKGIILATAYKKYNFRVNSEMKTGRLIFGESIAFTQANKVSEKVFNGGSMLFDAIRQTPALPVYDENAIGGFAGPTIDLHGQDYGNPVGSSNLMEDDLNTNAVLTNIYGQLKILDGLSYKLNIGIDYIGIVNTEYTSKYAMGDYNINLDADLSISHHNRITSLIENTLSYAKTIGLHDFVLLSGYTEQHSKLENLVASASGFPNDETRSLDKAFSTPSDLAYSSEFAIRSYLGRINYSYAGKYLLTANLRRDGSSRFSSNNRWSTFPSVSAAWRVSEENFFPSNSVISYLKLRSSYGLIGNQEIGDYQYETGLNYYAAYVFGTDQLRAAGVIPGHFGNGEIIWETTKQMDLGFDILMFDSRLQLTADYYSKDTRDMLIQVPIPFTTGNAALPPFTNAGNLKSHGIELSGLFSDTRADYNYSVSFNFSTARNEVTKLGAIGEPIMGGNFYGAPITRTAEGLPVGQFYGYITDGIYNTEEEITAMNKSITDASGNVVYNQFAPNAKPGDIRFRDLNSDGLLTELDKDYIGNPFPDLSYGIAYSADFKGLDFYFQFHGVYGNEIFMATVKWLEGMASNSNSGVSALDYWTPTNTSTNIPRPIALDPNNNLAISDRYIKDGSYFRLKNISIGYSINSRLLKRMHVSKLRVYIQGQNLFTITKYPGWDPEIGSYGFGQGRRGVDRANLVRGIDNGYYPQSKTILAGLQITF
jgi:TonB-dependent starch-binding outer membrane protein SusC